MTSNDELERRNFDAWFNDRYRGILDETNFKLVWVTALGACLARSKQEQSDG
ncbi:MAG: hypothetical protein E6X23_20670 [Mixta calida]|uniref:hypothetical protein n=1 Tax=Mixta calida TaxID=665913 RepID=UPI00290620A0|nr:hypothetical protein [Mixta calida]MDU4943918.1 hypothetical protein [Mixta calida]